MKKEISLFDIISSYENNIQDRIFCYKLSNGQTIRIAIFQEQICHLLGLQYVYNNDKHYLGEKGFQKIKSGIITIEALKAHNLKKFNYIKERLLFFDKLYEILINGQLIKFYPERTFPNTKIEADFLIYENGKQHIYHLFLRQEMIDDNLYSAVSFVVKSVNDKYPKQYLQQQEYKKIEEITIIITTS